MRSSPPVPVAAGKGSDLGIHPCSNSCREGGSADSGYGIQDHVQAIRTVNRRGRYEVTREPGQVAREHWPDNATDQRQRRAITGMVRSTNVAQSARIALKRTKAEAQKSRRCLLAMAAIAGTIARNPSTRRRPPGLGSRMMSMGT